MSDLFDSFGPVLTMAKKAILGGMGLSLRDGLRNSMNIFLNELYRLEDSQEPCARSAKSANAIGKIAETSRKL